jgi:hypothetical protein
VSQLTPEEEYAAKLVGTAIGAAVVFFLVLVVIFVYKATDQEGNEKPHTPIEWSNKNGTR